MHLAAGLGTEVTGALLQYGGDPNVRSQERMSPLHVAASYGDLDTLTLLLHNGANANIQDEDNNRPLDLAMENGNLLCVEELKRHTMLVTVDDCSGYTASCGHQESCHDNSCCRQVYFNNSCIDPAVLEDRYAKTITHEVYDYLSEGRTVCLDVTSPTTPLVGLKRKSGCQPGCESDFNVNNGRCAYASRPRVDGGSPCSLRSQQRVDCDSSYLSYSPQKVDDRSCLCQSPQRVCHGSHCSPYSQQRAHHDSTYFSNSSKRSIGMHHSPQRVNNHATYFSSSPKTFTNLLHSPQKNDHGSTHESSHSPQRRNHDSAYFSNSSPRSANLHHSPQRINNGTAFFSNAQQRFIDINIPHSGSPQRSTNLLHSPPRRVHPEIPCLPNSPHSPQRVYHSSTYLSHSPKYFNHETVETNVPSCQVQDVFHSPKRNPEYFTNSNDINYSSSHKKTICESGDCPSFSSTSPKICPINLKSNSLHFPKNSKKTRPRLLNNLDSNEKPVKDSSQHDDVKCPPISSLGSTEGSLSSTLSRVAEYVLSCSQFSSQCNVTEPDQITTNDVSYESQMADKENLSPHRNFNDNNISSSSGDSFCTANNDSNSDSTSAKCATNNNCSPSTGPVQKDTCFTKESVPSCNGDAAFNQTDSFPLYKGGTCCNQRDSLRRWDPPTQPEPNLLNDSIMTSENSSSIASKCTFSKNNLSNNKIINKSRNVADFQCGDAGNSRKTSELSQKRMELGYGLLPKTYNINENKELLLDDSLFSTITVEECLHVDPDSGITLLERRIPSECGGSIVSRRSIDSMSSKVSLDSQATLIYDWKDKKNSTLSYDHYSLESNGCEDVVIPLRLKKLSNEQLSQELEKFGEIPGPVIAATRQAYLKRLASFESNPGLVRVTNTCPDYPNELRLALNGSSLFDWSGLPELEMKMVENFERSQDRQWREGCAKSSFTYLLLDSRVTANLPLRAKDLSEMEIFKIFICAIFYIGKGKRARPYCHLYEAVSKMNHNCKMNDKVQHILDIWSSKLGVISLHCFQSVIPVEAYTREACMLEAIGMHKVTNVKRGDFYGVVSTWPMQQRRKLGVYLLHKAMKIFLMEGERQICIPDLKSSSQ